MPRYTISLGSNLPDGDKQVCKAMQWLATEFQLLEATPTYQSDDIKDASAPRYTNAIAVIASPLQPAPLTALLKSYETANGRLREIGQPVAIDLDLVTCDAAILRPRDYTAPYFRQGLPLLRSLPSK
jgi:2-amino-4-hydroxy-6-hydroxymethyldihydropteridine diphosphokinase